METFINLQKYLHLKYFFYIISIQKIASKILLIMTHGKVLNNHKLNSKITER